MEGASHDLGHVLERMGDAFVALDRAWHYVYVNELAGELFGRRPEDLVGRHIWTEFPEGVGQPFHLAYEEAARTGRPVTFEQHYAPWDRWYENRVFPTEHGVSIFFTDVTERRRTMDALARSDERHRALVDAVAAVVYRTDPAGTTLEATGWDVLTGRPTTPEGQDSGWAEAVHPGDSQRVLAAWAASLAAGEPFDCAYRLRDDAGSFRHVRARGLPVRMGDEVVEWIGVVQDVTAEAQAAEALRRAASEDALTGLPNRTAILGHLEHALHRRGARVGVLYVDLDGFKAVNDVQGHGAGDELLRHLAGALREGVRREDHVGRLGGDEFAVVCEDVGDEHAVVEVADRLRAAVAGATASAITASVGIAFGTAGEVAGDALVQQADMAMYEAKARGGDEVEVFDVELQRRVRRRHSVADDLRRGLEDGSWNLVFQPIVGLAGARPAVEALLRWRTPGGEAIPVAEVIDVAEGTGLIRRIGGEVLREACAQAARWAQDGLDLTVSVNVSGSQFAHADELVAAVGSALEASGLPADRLVLEITESTLVADPGRALGAIARVRELGVGLHLDDFGVGHSSLAALHRMPVDTVKVDRSFVARVEQDGEQLLSAIVGLGRALDLTVIAEGVETAHQLDVVRAAGCDAIQGFLLSRPVADADVPGALRTAMAACA